MRMRSLLLALLVCIGCANNEEPRSAGEPQSASDGRSGSVTEQFPQPASESPGQVPVSGADAYPDSREVQALLYRARQLRDEGRFEQSLALVEQALARDPHNPAAAELRQDLLEILTRV